MPNLTFLKQFPTKIVAVGLNYRNHAKEIGMECPTHPIIFLKPVSALIGPGDKIKQPKMSKQVDYEAELALVIGKRCKNVSKKDALNYVKGYTCLNDITARDIQKLDGQWTRSKSFDTFCAVGPKIIPKNKIKNPNNLDIECRLNRKTVQKSNTCEFIFSVEEIISFISQVMTLEKGDIITTGTPPGVGPMKKGDVVEIEIEGIGILENSLR